MNYKEFFYLQRPDRRALLASILVGAAVLAIVLVLGKGGSTGDTASAGSDTASVARRGYGYGQPGGTRLDRNSRHGSRAGDTYVYDDGTAPRRAERFCFDPNTADSTQLLRLGLRPWQVRSIYRYRAKGGVFAHATDFARVYGLTLKEYRELEPFIRISAYYRPASESIAPASQAARDGNMAARHGDTAARDTIKYPRKLVAGQRIALNTSDTTALKKVPGIGSYYARRIVEYRERLGGYSHAEQLLEIEGMPGEALAFFTVDGSSIKKLNINTMSVAQLRRHPYLNYYQARDIADYRRLKGPITDLSQLRLLRDFTEHDLRRLAPYIEY